MNYADLMKAAIASRQPKVPMNTTGPVSSSMPGMNVSVQPQMPNSFQPMASSQPGIQAQQPNVFNRINQQAYPSPGVQMPQVHGSGTGLPQGHDPQQYQQLIQAMQSRGGPRRRQWNPDRRGMMR